MCPSKFPRFLVLIGFLGLTLSATHAQRALADPILSSPEAQALEVRLFQQAKRLKEGKPGVEARRTYARELLATQELFDQIYRKNQRIKPSPVKLALLCSQLPRLEEAHAAIEEQEAQELVGIRNGAGARILTERFEKAQASRREAHYQLVGVLTYLKESLAAGNRDEALRFLHDYFEAHPVVVRTFNSRQGKTPVRSKQIRQDRIDISGLRRAGLPLPLAPQPADEDGGEAPQALATGGMVPGAGDLAETVDVVFTDEINDLAAELDNDPLKIFEYVRNECEFDPYMGSRRGADETRRMRAGNDMDLASLLIALLRTSGFHARYATGIVELTPEQAMDWLGVDDAATAGAILTTADLEGVSIYDGPDVASIRCRRVWVEAYLPYSNYRGANGGGGDSTWVPLDPAMKSYQCNFGVDLPTMAGLDSDAFVLDYVSTLRPENVLEYFDQFLESYATTNLPELNYPANRYTRSIITQDYDWLPASLPYRVLSRDDSYAEIPASKRFTIRLYIHGSGATLDHTMNLSAIAGKQVTLSYIAATPADQAYLDANGGVFGVPNPSLVQMIPELRVDGCVVATGTGSVMLGVVQTSDTTFTAPDGNVQTINNTVIAGNYEGHAYATGRTLIPLGESPDTDCPEDNLGWYLHLLGMKYLDRVDHAENECAELMQAIVLKDISNAILGQRISVGYVGPTPVTFDFFGLGVDADRNIVSPFSVYGTDIGYEFLRVSGLDGSLQENRVFEEEIGHEAVSTTKILALANDASIPVFTITPSNAGTYLPQLTHSAATYNRVLTAVSGGNHVTIPRDPLTYFLWTGTGYIDLDPVNGGAGYIISGGGSGGDTVDEEEEPPGCSGAMITEITPMEAGNIYSACDDRTITIKVEITSYDKDCEPVGTEMRETQFVPAALGVGSHPFRFGAPGSCGGCGRDGVTITVKDSGITVKDSNGRSAAGGRLEVVPQGIGETITCSAPDAPGSPTWTISGITSEVLNGQTVTFNAANWLTHLTLLYDIIPQNYQVKYEDCDATFTVAAYSNKKGTITLAAPDLESILKFLDALDGVVEKVGSPVSIKPSFGGSASFENQWKEKSGSNLAAYTWTFGGEFSAGITVKVSFGTGLVGLPPPLAEAAVFVSLGGKIGLKGSASVDTEVAFQVEGGSFGSVTVGVGGEISIGSGAISVTLVAESGIGATAFFGGTSEPPEVYAQTKVEAGQLDISYKTGALWGLWEDTETWRAWDPWVLYDDKVTIFPW